VSVRAENGFNSRQITAGAEYNMNTIFLRLAGLNQLQVPAVAAAAETAQNAEISLVLDISGSMARERANGTSSSRLQVLRAAASNFIDIVLTESARSTTSISLVPYAGQVNAGPLFNHFNTSRVHNYSSCIEFTASDFNVTTLPSANSRAQVPHFQWFNYEATRGHDAEWGWCPNDNRPIVPFSNDPDALKASIANFSGHDGTGTQIGLKWGLGLLDPSSQPLIQTLVNAGVVNAAFENRPVAFDDTGAVKIVVLMTDGNIRFQQRPQAGAYDTEFERHLLASNKLSESKSVLDSSFKRNNDEAIRTSQFQSLCDRAKSSGVTVFTIGFDISSSSPAFNEMRNCASTFAHFYDVDGIDLDAAFKQIAGIINRLKLVM
jgi:hypothetical protein